MSDKPDIKLKRVEDGQSNFAYFVDGDDWTNICGTTAHRTLAEAIAEMCLCPHPRVPGADDRRVTFVVVSPELAEVLAQLRGHFGGPIYRSDLGALGGVSCRVRDELRPGAFAFQLGEAVKA